MEVDINLDDLINCTDNGTGTDIWVKDDTMFNGKRLYILAISFEAFKLLLNDASTIACDINDGTTRLETCGSGKSLAAVG
jgi:hypothetical protein